METAESCCLGPSFGHIGYALGFLAHREKETERQRERDRETATPHVEGDTTSSQWYRQTERPTNSQSCAGMYRHREETEK